MTDYRNDDVLRGVAALAAHNNGTNVEDELKKLRIRLDAPVEPGEAVIANLRAKQNGTTEEEELVKLRIKSAGAPTSNKNRIHVTMNGGIGNVGIRFKK